MKPQETIETMGRIVKVETLTSVDYNIMKNTLVLENSEPFPGYFGHNIPKDSVPRSIFVVMDKKYKKIKLRRIIAKIKKQTAHTCDISCGSIKIYTNKYYCLRVNGLTCFDQIPKLQGLMQENGIKFMKAKKIHASGKIVLNKYFKVKEAEDHIFKNLVQTEQYFITIPDKLKWKEFYDMTMRIKHNIDNKIFDAALGFMYHENTIVDFVRIFDRDQSPERMKQIRDMYLHEVKRIQKS